MLRIGDVSFVDAETHKITGLGEIKSCEEHPGSVRVNIQMLGPSPKVQSIFVSKPEESTTPPLTSRAAEPSQRMKEQLRRQLKAMAEAFQPRQGGHSSLARQMRST